MQDAQGNVLVAPPCWVASVSESFLYKATGFCPTQVEGAQLWSYPDRGISWLCDIEPPDHTSCHRRREIDRSTQVTAAFRRSPPA